MRGLYVALLALFIAREAGAQAPCSSVQEPAKRLACFDSLSSVAASSKAPEALSRIPAAPPEGSHRAKIQSIYDKFRDQTTVVLSGVSLKATMSLSPFDLTALFLSKGQTVTEPPIVTLGFAMNSSTWRFLQCHDVVLLADDQRVIPVVANHEGDVQRDASVRESVVSHFRIADFLKLANANRIEGQICTTRFTIAGEDLLALKDFASRMNPAPPR